VADKEAKKRYYRKRVDFFRLIQKIKIWPSRKGVLHGIKSINIMGSKAEIVTHCNERFIISNSKKSRAARWVRNKLFFSTCKVCKIPPWKLEKYSSTYFSQHVGSELYENPGARAGGNSR